MMETTTKATDAALGLRAMGMLCVLVAMLVVSGCGNGSSRVPELVEPRADTDLQQYRLAAIIVENARAQEATLDSLRAFRLELEQLQEEE